MHDASFWERIPVEGIEDLKDAVYGAGLEATQMSRGPVSGSILFAERRGVLYTSGHIGGRIALQGPLSQDGVTLGLGLALPPGTRHWMSDVGTGDVGVFLPGDEHDSLYAPGSLYATVTLASDHLEEIAAQAGFVLNARTLGGTGVERRRFSAPELRPLRARFRQAHRGGRSRAAGPTAIGVEMLGLLVRSLGRAPRVARPLDRQGLARVVRRARSHIREHLDQPLSIEAIAAAALTSHRTLHRAFQTLLDEPPYSHVMRLRLHRIRTELVGDAEKGATITAAANHWGVSELGRFSAWYRDLFGELPSETIRRTRKPEAPESEERGLARSA